MNRAGEGGEASPCDGVSRRGRQQGAAQSRLLLACLLAVPASLAACDRQAGDASEVSVPSRPGRPSFEQVCALVTRAEVETALGRKVVGRRSDPATFGKRPPLTPGMQFCRFAGDGAGVAAVSVGLASAFAPQAFKEAVARLQAEGFHPQPVRNLGEDAVSYFGGTLLVLEGRHVLYISVARPEQPPEELVQPAPPAARERNVTLALKALERLPKGGDGHSPSRR